MSSEVISQKRKWSADNERYTTFPVIYLRPVAYACCRGVKCQCLHTSRPHYSFWGREANTCPCRLCFPRESPGTHFWRLRWPCCWSVQQILTKCEIKPGASDRQAPHHHSTSPAIYDRSTSYGTNNITEHTVCIDSKFYSCMMTSVKQLSFTRENWHVLKETVNHLKIKWLVHVGHPIFEINIKSADGIMNTINSLPGYKTAFQQQWWPLRQVLQQTLWEQTPGPPSKPKVPLADNGKNDAET